MFRIILSERQLIDSVKYSIKNDADPLLGIFQNCNFVINDKKAYEYLKIAKEVLGQFYCNNEAETIAEVRLRNLLDLGCIANSKFLVNAPFSFYVESNIDVIQKVLKYDPENATLEYAMEPGFSFKGCFDNIRNAFKTKHLLIYDPFFLDNFNDSIGTISYIFDLNEPCDSLNICVITTLKSVKLSAKLSEIQKCFGGNLSVLIIPDKMEHDRRSFSDIYSIKVGNGFAFLRNGQYFLKSGSTMDIKTLLNSNNFIGTHTKYQKLLAIVHSKYCLNAGNLNPLEKEVSNKFMENNYIRNYFKMNERL